MSTLAWPANSICLQLSSRDDQRLADDVYRRVCRTDFAEPGFCLINCGPELDSVSFRQLMVTLKTSISSIHAERTGQTLIYLSAARFDQQETTRPHLDGGPEECFLM